MIDEGRPSAVLRRERAQRAVAELRGQIAAWLAGWRDASEQTSQIARVGHTLRALLARLAARADAIGAEGFTAARAVEADVAVVERLWRYVGDRFDQRRDPRLAPTLQIADDVIWACTAEARAVAAATARPMPLPLAYIEPAFSPTAIPRCEPPLALDATDAALARALAFLPVPLIGLPTSVVREPWWLVLIAHEVGHHVQYDLEPDAALVDRAADVLARTGGRPGDAEDDERWRGWAREVFADAVAVATAGPAAIDAIAELEWDDADALVAERGPYPPVIVRLALAAEVARALAPGAAARAVPTLASLQTIVAAARARVDGERAASWAARAPAVAAALASMPLAGGTLADLHARCTGDERGLERALRGEELGLTRGRVRPLRVAAAAFRAYRQLASVDDAARDAGYQRLRARVPVVVAQVRADDEVVRAGGATRADDSDALAAGLEAVLHGARRPA